MSDKRQSWELDFSSPGLVSSPTRTMAQQNEEATSAIAEKMKSVTKTIAETERYRAGYADTMIAALKRQLEPLMQELQPDEEIGALLTNFGTEQKIRVHNIGHEDPHLIVIKGVDEKGEAVTLLQHVSQVNILFRKIKVNPGQTARRVAFIN